MGARTLATIEYCKVNGRATRARERIVMETGLSIFVNGKHLATAMIIPTMVKEFIIGHLFGQRVINSAADIESITIKGNIRISSIMYHYDIIFFCKCNHFCKKIKLARCRSGIVRVIHEHEPCICCDIRGNGIEVR